MNVLAYLIPPSNLPCLPPDIPPYAIHTQDAPANRHTAVNDLFGAGFDGTSSSRHEHGKEPVIVNAIGDRNAGSAGLRVLGSIQGNTTGTQRTQTSTVPRQAAQDPQVSQPAQDSQAAPDWQLPSLRQQSPDSTFSEENSETSSLSPQEKAHAKGWTIFVGGMMDEENDQDVQLWSVVECLRRLDPQKKLPALLEELPFKWAPERTYDTVSPFGDERDAQYTCAWIIDLENEVLVYWNRRGKRLAGLELIHEGRVYGMHDLDVVRKHVWALLPLFKIPKEVERTQWRPELRIDERVRSLTHRLMRDLNHVWRHVLRGEFGDRTLRVFVAALVGIAKLDFEVKEETGRRVSGKRGRYVWLTDLPKWEPWNGDLLEVGGVRVVVDRNVSEGVSRARQHARRSGMLGVAEYMVLSVRQIVLCRWDPSLSSFMSTVPRHLLTGMSLPSIAGMDILLWALRNTRRISATSLQTLPVELLDEVLENINSGMVSTAKFGCEFALGSPFLWRDGNLEIELVEWYTHRGGKSGSPIESQIWFQDHPTGLVYRGRKLNA